MGTPGHAGSTSTHPELPERTPEELGAVIASRPSAPPPAPWGPRWLQVSVWASILASAAFLATQLGAQPHRAAVVWVLIPSVVLIAAAGALTHFAPPRGGTRVLAVAWGASTAAVIALVLNETGLHLVGSLQLTAVLVAPIVEELAKAVPLVLLRRRIQGPAMALGVAVLSAGAFALCEDAVYFIRAAQHGPGLLAVTVLARGVWAPLLHPSFTVCSALGMLAALRAPRRRTRIAWRSAGVMAAVASHGAWNFATDSDLLVLAVIPMALGLLLAVALAARAVRNELHWLRALPAAPVEPGLPPGPGLDRDEVLVLASVPWRRRSRRPLSRRARRRWRARARDLLELALLERRLSAVLPAGPVPALRARHAALAHALGVVPETSAAGNGGALVGDPEVVGEVLQG